MKVVINSCFGGFGLSTLAYEKLIEWGVPVQKYHEQERDKKTALYKEQPLNNGRVIFDRDLTPEKERKPNDSYWKFRTLGVMGRYWDTWLDGDRTHPLLVRVVEELGAAADGHFAKLRIVEIPDDVDYVIEEYDGAEHIAEKHRQWRG